MSKRARDYREAYEAMPCETCAGSGWVCEAHPDKPSEVTTANGCTCGEPATNCACNPGGDAQFDAVYASNDPSNVKEWIQ